MNEYIDSHLLSIKNKQHQCSNFVHGNPTYYEYMQSLVKKDMKNLEIETVGRPLVQLTIAVMTRCLEKSRELFRDFVYSDYVDREVCTNTTQSIVDVISSMTLNSTGDKKWLGIRHTMSLADEVYLRSVVTGYTISDALHICCVNDWTAVAKICPIDPIDSKCHCVPDPEADSLCCTDLSCILQAQDTECGSDCNAGERCGNQQIRRRAYDHVQLCYSKEKGFGLLTTKLLEKNQLAIEYTGIVRVANSEWNSYTVDLKQKKLVIDASTHGGFARFVNHSCDPNCILKILEVSSFGPLLMIQ
jgi:hypothetical protein